jgi:hypothetical protein
MTWKLAAIGTHEQEWVPEEEKKAEATRGEGGGGDQWRSGWSDRGSWGKAEKAEWDSRESRDDHGSRKRRRGGGGGWPSSRPVAPRADEAMRSIQVMMLNCRVSIAC